MQAKPKTAYVVASPQTWELIRAAYLSGQSAPTVAARFGINVGALRKRARREGWTKAAHARSVAAPAATAAANNEAAPAWALPRHISPMNVARKALNDAARALHEGRPTQAQAYAKAADLLMRLEGFIPDVDEVESDQQFQWRQSVIQDVIEEKAGALIEQLMTGQPVEARYAALAERWNAAGAHGTARMDSPLRGNERGEGACFETRPDGRSSA